MTASPDDRWNAPRLSPDTTRGTTFGRTMLRMRPLRPSRTQLVDAGFGLFLAVLALWGFRDTFDGYGFLVVGVLGVVLGLFLAHLAHAFRLPVVVLVALTLVTFFVIGSVAALGSAPLPRSFEDLARLSVLGWKELLTTLPPVDGDGPLLVLPYLLGLLSGAIGQSLATRSRSTWAPVASAVLLLGVVIVLGVAEPASLLVQGIVFGLVCLGWMSVRGQRATEVVSDGSGRLVRLGSGLLVLAVAGVVAQPLGTQVLASGQERIVLRDEVVPPFDVGKYPSPLAGFRKYRPANGPGNKATRVDDKVLLSVAGAPVGTPIRIATLDAYDGNVWGASNAGGSPGEIADTFQRVSSTIRNPLAQQRGTEHDVTVTLGEAWTGVWLPTIGAVTSIEFLDDADGAEADSFRYNLATSTAVVPAGTAPGDRYRMSGVVLDQELTDGMGASSSVTVDANFLATQANSWSEGQTDPLPRVLLVAEHLKEEGGYTDGLAPFQRYGPGHFVGRLATFVNGDQIAGNDEQYASTLALMANQLGMPARVVLGATLPESLEVKGKDVHAWVEVRVADGTWRTIPTESFLPEEKPDENPPQPQTEYAGAVVPPPAPVPPPSTVGDPADGELDQSTKRRDTADDETGGGGLPAWVGVLVRWAGPPLAALLLFVATVLGLKARRRRRRQHAPVVTERFSGGWSQVVDRARDLRLELPPEAQTRSEQAAVLPTPSARAVATVADDRVFGPGQPTEESAQEYWSEVDRLCRELSSGVGPVLRLRAALSLVSLRRNRSEASS